MYPNLHGRILHLWSRLQVKLWGRTFLGTNVFPLSIVATIDCHSQLFQATNTTIFYAPGIDPSTTMIYPLVRSNETGIHPVSTTTQRLMASNGLTMVHLGSNTIKIYPTADAAKYANSPID